LAFITRIEAKNVVWQGAYDADSGMWVGVCKAFNLNALGETWSELQECANDAMATLFVDLFVTGELAEFLRENGWQHGPMPQPGQVPQFDIPVPWEPPAKRIDQLVPA
jgi:hypothetical protein